MAERVVITGLGIVCPMGHDVEIGNAMGSTQTVMRIDGGFLGASDPRRVGAAAQGY